MTMIRDRLDIGVDVRIEVLSALALIDAAGHHVPEMGDDTRAHQQLALGVVVDAPGIAEAVRDDLEAILRRVVAPHAAVDLDAVAAQDVRGKRIPPREQPALPRPASDFRMRGESLQAVEPAVRSPMEAVHHLVSIRMPQPVSRTSMSVDVGLVVAVAIGHEEEIRWRADEDAVEADRQSGRKNNPSMKTLRLSATPSRSVSSRMRMRLLPALEKPRPLRFVVEVLRHPEAATIVPAEGHRADDHRFAGPRVDRESVDGRHRGDGLLGR